MENLHILIKQSIISISTISGKSLKGWNYMESWLFDHLQMGLNTTFSQKMFWCISLNPMISQHLLITYLVTIMQNISTIIKNSLLWQFLWFLINYPILTIIYQYSTRNLSLIQVRLARLQLSLKYQILKMWKWFLLAKSAIKN